MTYTINETVYSEGEYQQMQNWIRKYAEATRNIKYDDTASAYWTGVRDTYQALLNEVYGGDWAVHGSIGWFVFIQMEDYITAKESAKAYQLGDINADDLLQLAV